ncbi:MAG: response regulator [Dyella sp.]|nr:response regulator [Dyella sp.]MBV8272015.1 response regulator [Cupriavidus sp.]
MRKQSMPRPISLPSSSANLLEGERHFRLLADGIPHIVLTANPDGWIDYCNQRWATYTGLTLEETQMGAWQTVIHPDDLQGTRDRWRSALASGCEYELEFRLRRASDRAYRWHLARGAPFKDIDGNIVKWFGTCTDIEDQKQAQTTAESANRAKSDFLSSMSHELRSPLNAILGFAQLMASDSPRPTSSQQTSIDQILKAGWHLLELINEVLDLAKIEAGQASLSPEPVSVADALRECHSMVEQQALKRGVGMRFPSLDHPCYVRADRTRFKQILLNLLSNAIKYNREHGTVEVQCGETLGGRIHISVRDTGAGLEPERLAQLFQPFNRLGQEAGLEEGTGIGLVVAKRLVELMEGAIGAESAVGVGSVFWIELAVASAPEMTGESVGPAVPTFAQERALPSVHTLLYVEDNPANLKLVEQLTARRPDFRLLTAVTGALGVDLARTSLPDVIVMDIHLPDINGIEALRLLREDQRTRTIPVIALSANAMPRDIEKGIQAGFLRYLTKPIKLNEFIEAITAAVTQTHKITINR